MRNRMLAIVAGLVAVAVGLIVTAAFASSVLAQTPAQTPAPSYGPGAGNGPMSGYGRQGMSGMHGMMQGMAGRGHMGGPENSLISVAAEQLGMERAELIAALDGTKSIAQIAAERNVALDTIVNAFIAPRAEHLDELVADERLTREEADQMLATMRTNVNTRLNEVWTPRGPGEGMGFVDENGDGVCDNMGEGHTMGPRGQMGPGQRGQGRGYR